MDGGDFTGNKISRKFSAANIFLDFWHIQCICSADQPSNSKQKKDAHIHM